jgi:hypothetical protein
MVLLVYPIVGIWKTIFYTLYGEIYPLVLLELHPQVRVALLKVSFLSVRTELTSLGVQFFMTKKNAERKKRCFKAARNAPKSLASAYFFLAHHQRLPVLGIFMPVLVLHLGGSSCLGQQGAICQAMAFHQAA